MLALIGNINLLELAVVLVVALMIFGRNLPEVTMRGAAHLMRLRKTVAKMWREAGLEEELRRVKRDIENETRELKKIEPYDFGMPTTPTDGGTDGPKALEPLDPAGEPDPEIADWEREEPPPERVGHTDVADGAAGADDPPPGEDPETTGDEDRESA